MRAFFNERFYMALLCCIAVAAPFLCVTFVPITDLPQQAAQIRLLTEVLNDQNTPYKLQVFTPNSLSFVVFGLCWALFEPLDVGRMTMIVVGFLWVFAIHYLAHIRGRPSAAAVIATLLFFNHTVYWGFYNFAIGFPVFIAWFLFLSRKKSSLSLFSDGAMTVLIALLLYMAHALWLAAGIVWFAISHVILKIPLRLVTARLIGLSPVVTIAALWYVRFTKTAVAQGSHWFTSPLQRLTPSTMVDSAFGGLAGPGESLLFTIIIGWMISSIWQNRNNLWPKCDHLLLWAAAMFFVFSFVLPNKHNLTIQFAERWFPPGMLLLILIFPAPKIRLSLQRALSIAVVYSWILFTAYSWLQINKNDFSGLRQTLNSLPESQSVLGLDFLKSSPYLKTYRPFVQAFAYSQVAKGGELNFSFAEIPYSLVTYKSKRLLRWTGGLDWYPEWVKTSDYRYFQYVIVSGDEHVHKALDPSLLKSVTFEGYWRLYKSIPGYIPES